MTISQSQQDISRACDRIKELLLEKNKKYGDAALNPRRVMSRANSVEQILIRIDDKLNRIQKGAGLLATDEDVVQDLAGYFILLMIALERQKNETKSLDNAWDDDVPYVGPPSPMPTGRDLLKIAKNVTDKEKETGGVEPVRDKLSGAPQWTVQQFPSEPPIDEGENSIEDPWGTPSNWEHYQVNRGEPLPGIDNKFYVNGKTHLGDVQNENILPITESLVERILELVGDVNPGNLDSSLDDPFLQSLTQFLKRQGFGRP